MASLVTLPEFYFMKFIPNGEQSSHCFRMLGPKSEQAYLASWNTISIFLPLMTIIIIQYHAYNVLKHSSDQLTKDAIRIRSLKKVFRTFLVVIAVFFLLTAPATIFDLYVWHIMVHHRPIFVSKVSFFHKLRCIFYIILSLNSCVNPLIYANLGTKFRLIVTTIASKLGGASTTRTSKNSSSVNSMQKTSLLHRYTSRRRLQRSLTVVSYQ